MRIATKSVFTIPAIFMEPVFAQRYRLNFVIMAAKIKKLYQMAIDFYCPRSYLVADKIPV